MRKPLITTLLCIFAFTSVIARTEPDRYILCINSYAESSPWSNRILSAVTEYVGRNPGLALYAEHMNMLLVDSGDSLGVFMDSLVAKYDKPAPAMLLLLGNPSLMLREEYREAWGDIPIVLCGEADYVGPDPFYLNKESIPEDQRTSVASLAAPYNLVFHYSNLYIRENVDLIARMVPGMKRFVFIDDQRQVNSANAFDIERILKADYPDVEFLRWTAKQMTTNQLLDSLYAVDTQTTGLLFSSWIQKTTFYGNTSLAVSGYKLIGTAPVPLFSLNLVDFKNDEHGMVGGYAYDEQSYNAKLISNISRILAGSQARELPFYLPKEATPVVNYNILVHRGLSPALCPPDTLFLNKPPTFWEQNGWVVMIAGGVILLLSLLAWYRIRNLDMVRAAQQKELAVMNDYRDLITNMPVIYMRVEPVAGDGDTPADLIFRKVNPSFEKDIEPEGDVVGRRFSELFPETTHEFLQFVRIALAEKKAIVFSWYYRKNGLFYEAVLKGTSQQNLIDIFCIDATELHRAQQKLSEANNKLSMALDVASIVPWKWDLASHTILCDVNRPIELSAMGESVDEMQLAVPDSQYFAKIFKEDRERVEKAYKDLITGVTEKVKEEYRILDVSNGLHNVEWVEAQAAVEKRDANGTPLTLVGSSLVITKRKKMEMELITAKDRAEESNRLKSAFLANMSHEIRTPLNAIVGFSGILASSEAQDEKNEYINIIENNNTLLLQLISDILDLSKIESGALDLHYSNVDLDRLMKELEGSCGLRIKSDAVTLRFEDPAENSIVYTEKNRLSQVMINLITNAIKFTEKGSIRFSYGRKGDELYFYVKDTGCGIPKEKQESIFGRFVKLNSFAQGTGLGLSICQTLVENMGGRIGVESEVGEGATFWFTLPYKAAGAMGEEEVIKKTEIEPVFIEKDKITVLIAEDSDSNYKLFESILKYDYHLIHAWDGQEAVELFKKYNPQVILMDINMPVMDGYEATHAIRKYSAKVPIIAITAYAYASDEHRVMESGFDGYMPKPINARLLKAQLADIMSKRVILL